MLKNMGNQQIQKKVEQPKEKEKDKIPQLINKLKQYQQDHIIIDKQNRNDLMERVNKFFSSLSNIISKWIENSKKIQDGQFQSISSNKLLQFQQQEQNQIDNLEPHEDILKLLNSNTDVLSVILLPIKNIKKYVDSIINNSALSLEQQNILKNKIKIINVNSYDSFKTQLGYLNFNHAIYCIFFHKYNNNVSDYTCKVIDEEALLTQIQNWFTLNQDNQLIENLLIYMKDIEKQFIDSLTNSYQIIDKCIQDQINLFIDIFNQNNQSNNNSLIHYELNNGQIKRKQKFKTYSYNRNLGIEKEQILWIQKDINENELQKVRQSVFSQIVKPFQSFDEFLLYIENEKEESIDCSFQKNNSQVLNFKINEARQNLDQSKLLSRMNQANLEEEEEKKDQENLLYQQSVIYKQEICLDLYKNNVKREIFYDLILPAELALSFISNIPKVIKRIYIYSSNADQYESEFNGTNQFLNQNKIKIITNKIEDLIKAIEDQQKIIKTVYNCKHINLHKYFVLNNPLYYICDSTFTAESIIQYEQNQIVIMIEEIKKFYPNIDNFNVQNLAKSIKEHFISKEKILKLFTTNQRDLSFYQFINIILSQINEDALLKAQYFIKTLRYAHSKYQDQFSQQLMNPLEYKQTFNNLKLYRGLQNIDVQQFQNDFPIKTIFIIYPFQSSTADLSIAQFNAANSKFIFEFSFQVINHEEFEKCRPKYINKVAQFEEEEYLFRCFSSFVVINYRIENGFTFVELQFIENPII